MANKTQSDEEILSKALELFRRYGYAGVSLSQLSAATGLEKASLYYRFPGGKDEIAMAAAGTTGVWFAAHVFGPLKGNGPLKKRVAAAADGLRKFYADGTKSCITDVLSIPGASEELQAALKEAMRAWVSEFAALAREAGMTPAAAKVRAEDVIGKIEGALVMSRVLGDNGLFLRVMRTLPELLTGM